MIHNQRYMVVHYPEDVAKNHGLTKDGFFINHLPIHELLGTYHWARLDKDYVIVTGDYPIAHSKKLTQHKAVFILPHLASTRSIASHGLKAAKNDHTGALVGALKLPDSATMTDIVEAIEERFGVLFSPNR